MLASRDSSAMRYEGSAVWGDATRASPNRRGQPDVGCADGGDAVTCRRIRGVSGLRAAPSIVTPREMASNMTSPWWCPSCLRWCCMFGIKYIMGRSFHPSLSNTPFFSSHTHTHTHTHTLTHFTHSTTTTTSPTRTTSLSDTNYQHKNSLSNTFP